MLQFQDFAAWIEIEGDKCLEYCVENSNKEATCWIASEEGKVFTIHWTCSKQATATWPVCGRAFVDGRPCGGKLCRPAEKNRHLVHTGIRSSPTVKKPFLFTHIDFTDDDSQMDTMSDAFGQIELVLRHVELIKDSRSSSAALLPVPEKQKHHERSKKGLVHEVGFGEDTAARASTSSGSIDIGEPLVVFRFRYRTLDQLIANGIAPRPMKMEQEQFSPEPSETSTQWAASPSKSEPDTNPMKKEYRPFEPSSSVIGKKRRTSSLAIKYEADNMQAISSSEEDADPEEILKLRARLARLERKAGKKAKVQQPVKLAMDLKREAKREFEEIIDLT